MLLIIAFQLNLFKVIGFCNVRIFVLSILKFGIQTQIVKVTLIDLSFKNQIHQMTVSDSSKTIALTHCSNDNHTCILVEDWLGL